MSACSIYTHPRASPVPITPLNLGSGWSHSCPCCVLLVLLALFVFPGLPALLDIVPGIWSPHLSVSKLSAAKLLTPKPSDTLGDTWGCSSQTHWTS